MSKLLEELELKLSLLDIKIENKINFVKNLYQDQQGLLNEHFNTNSLKDRYSNGLNNFRERLLQPISVNLRLEINHVNESVKTNGSFQTNFALDFNRSIIRSGAACIMRLIMKEFKFGCKFSASQLVKYKRILEIKRCLVIKENIFNCDKSLTYAFGIPNESSYSEIVRLLIDAGASINPIDKWNGTALTLASEKGHLDTVKYLVRNGANVNGVNASNSTALVLAFKNGHFEIVKYLVENGADLNTQYYSGYKYYNGFTALILAIHRAQFEMIKYLIENGSDVNFTDKYDKTVLMYVSEKGHFGIVKCLVEHGADVNAKNIWNETALM